MPNGGVSSRFRHDRRCPERREAMPNTVKRPPHRVDVRLTEEQAEALRELAEEQDRSMRATAARLIVLGIKRHQARSAR
jgi:hypothetical protein